MNFSLIKAGEKVIRGVVAGGISVLATLAMKHLGLEITADQQLVLVTVVFGVIAGLCNLLKHTLPKIFWWL
jgi:hypothetical protein